MSPSLSVYEDSTFHWLKLGGVWLILVSLTNFGLASWHSKCGSSSKLDAMQYLQDDTMKRQACWLTPACCCCQVMDSSDFVFIMVLQMTGMSVQGNVWVMFGLLGPNGVLCIGGLLATVVCWR